MINRILIFVFTAMMTQSVWGQEDCYNYDQHTQPEDTIHEVHSVKEFFTGGKVEGHMRNYFMVTYNQGDLKDYWANATGGALSYHTDVWKGWQFGVKGIFTFNTASSDLNELDTLVGKSAKWEKELFDVSRPYVTHDLDRLEELFLKYHFRSSYITFGKIDINKGPLLLKRDGRMKPFVYKGLWGDIKEVDKTTINVGWIYAVSSRGMTEWQNLSEAIGSNNNGHQPDGSSADYKHQVHTNGLFVLGIERELSPHLKLKGYDYYLNHLINVNWLQLDYDKGSFFGGIQYVFEVADPHQKHLDYQNRYYQPDEQAHVVNGMFGLQSKDKKIKLSGAYLHSFGTGRFIFPKELTREGFYVSQPRSWVEGYADLDVFVVRAELRFNKKGWSNWSFDTRLTSFSTDGVDSYRNNKYGMPSYYQGTFLVNYSPKKVMTGVHFTFMYVAKYTPEKLDLTYSQTFYKTNLHHLNLIMNVYF